MGKYIINVDDKYVSPDNELIVSHKNLFDGCSYHIQIAKLTPYTEPDLDAIRKEVHDKCMSEAEDLAYKLYSPKIDKAYQRGLNDAWEAVRKITKMNDKEASAIFGTWLFQKIFEGNSASEAIEKLQEHEQGLIKMGDEVLYEDSKGVVIAPEENGHWAAVFTAGGERICVPDYKLRKTGKHYPEIANIVRELRKK